MSLAPGNDQHSDVLWFYRWLTEPGRSVDEFRYAVEALRQKVSNIMIYEFEEYATGEDIYILRVAAEAIASINPVLEGNWEEIAWGLFFCNLDELEKNNLTYGHTSNRFGNWVINVIGNPEMCPNPDLRIHMLQLYRTVIKLDHNNREQAFESLMLATTYLDRHAGRDFIHSSKDVAECFELFTEDDYLMNIAQELVNKMKINIHTKQQIILHDISQNYGMGLKNVSQPIKIKSLIALLGYIRDGDICEGDFLYESSGALYWIVKHFKKVLEEPELIDITVETIMTVLEAVIHMFSDQGDIYFSSPCLDNVNEMLDEFVDEFEEDADAAAVDLTKVGQEIVSRYKQRISKIRAKISEGYPSLLQAMVFGKINIGREICDIIYNDKWYKGYFASIIGHE